MKTKYIKSDHLFSVWTTGVEELLFPRHLVKELNPAKTLEDWGYSVIEKRKVHRAAVDSLINKLLDRYTPEYILNTLRQTDPTIVALYFDRVEAATHALETVIKEKKMCEIPESWHSVVSGLLLQKIFQ